MSGFVPPPYPYDRLDRLRPLSEAHAGGTVDLSIGTPFDPPPQHVIDALAASGSERSYPASIGSPAFREAAQRWMRRRFDVEVPVSQIGASIGTKEFVATLPQWLALRTPSRDTVLYPAIAYPTYEMGAILAGCRPVAGGRHADRPTRPRFDRSGRRRAGAGAVGEQPEQSDGRTRRPRGGRDLGTRARGPGVLRRVLCRVHLVGSWSHDSGIGPRRARGRALVVEAVEPRRSARRLLCG